VVGGGADHHTRGARAPQTAAVPSLGEALGRVDFPGIDTVCKKSTLVKHEARKIATSLG